MRIAIACNDYVERFRCDRQKGLRLIELATAYANVLAALPKCDTLIVYPEYQN